MTHPTLPDGLDHALLDRLLRAHGIGSEFIEFSGDIKRIALADRYRVLAAMGQAPVDASQLRAALARMEAAAFRALAPVLLLDGAAPSVSIWLPAPALDRPCRWTLTLDGGEQRAGEASLLANPDQEVAIFEGARWHARRLVLPPMPLGYHSLQINQGEREWHSLLIVAPDRAWRSPKLEEGGRCWGVSVQLYTVRSGGDCGIGDFGDLKRMVELAAAQGADFILLNPLHALDPRYPENASPYSPSDRRFLNPLYICLSDVPGFAEEQVQSLWRNADTQAALQAVRSSPLVRYADVSALKFSLLELLHARFAGQPGSVHKEYDAWCVSAGEPLAQFAAFQASLGAPGSVAANPDYHRWLQWLAHRQFDASHAHALALGMSLGLVRDLAVGSSVDGCEVMSNRDQYCLDARIGAPPDNFNPGGQNWGLPPLLPAALEADEFRMFRELLQSNMRSCGALRIDHVLALFRLWWCADDGSNATGAYVHYPVDLLFAILRLESVRNQCVVIGEDLGVVPPEIRQYLDGGGIYSNCVFYFEKYDSWHFRKPEHYKPQALAMQANHDVAPLTAWWNGTDLVLRRQLGLIPDDEKLAQEQHWRRGERGQLLQWLDEQGLLPAEWQPRPLDAPINDVLRMALTRGFARVASQLLSVQLDDLARVEQPVNIPGTSVEYANWRRKLPDDLETIFASPFAQRLLRDVHEARSK